MSKPAVPSAVLPPVGIAGWCLPGDQIDQIRHAHTLGFKHIQIDCGGPGRGLDLSVARLAERVGAAATVAGITITALAGNRMNDIGLCHEGDSAGGRAARDALRNLVDVALRLDVGLLFVPSFRRGQIAGPEDLAQTADALGWIAGQAPEMMIASENGLDAADAERLLDRAAKPNLRLVLDPLNTWHMGSDPLALVDLLHARLASQVHVKNGTEGLTGNTLLSDGDQAIDRVVRQLRDADSADPNSAAERMFVLETDYRLIPDPMAVTVADDRRWLDTVWTGASPGASMTRQVEFTG